MTQISAILPIKTRGRHYADNIGRCDILFASLRQALPKEHHDRILAQAVIAWQHARRPAGG